MSRNADSARAVILAPRGRDALVAATILREAGLEAHVTGSISTLISDLAEGAGYIIVTEESLVATDLKPLVQWLKKQEEWSDLPFILLTNHGGLERNPMAAQFLEVLGNVTFLERPFHPTTFVSLARAAVRARRRQYDARATLTTLRESEAALRATQSSLRDANENLEVRVQTRTGELMKAEDALRQAQKMEAVGQLTGGLAHDFNNMLAIVVGALNMLSRRLKNTDPTVVKYIDAAHEGAQRATQLTQRLLAFSRRQALEPKAVDADKLVLGMLELLRGTLGRDIILEAIPCNGAGLIFVDPGQLENAIVNIALNARDAMPNGGKLTIETRDVALSAEELSSSPDAEAGQFVLIKITDTGNGIPEEIIGKVFEPFFTTKTVGKGTGLGLSQVYGFLKQSGGHIKISSQPTVGTSVKLYLPRHTAAAAADATHGTQEAALSEGHKEIILVVDDEPAVRSLAADALEELGYQAIEATDGLTALKLLEERPEIDLLMTDIVMPDLNGRMLADRAQRSRPDLKVLFMTGYSRDAVVHNGVLDPGVHLIGKPFTIEELSDKVRSVLSEVSRRG